jgi:hypothetical protein
MTQADSVLSTPRTTVSKINPPVDQTRRHLLTIAAGGAVAAAIPTAWLAAAPAIDPIFAAIDAHRKAHADHLAAIGELSRLEKIHGVGGRDWSITEKPCDDENEAFGLLVGTAATTVAGLFAKFNYLREIAEHEAWMLDEREGTALDLIESFAGSIQNIWRVRS